MAISRKLVLSRIEDNVGESDWEAWDILAQALEFMDDKTLEKFYLQYHFYDEE